MIPHYQFESLRDSSIIYNRQYFSGKIYLIDFWGTWCAPCIEEMPFLHKAYKKYKSEGFNILSVAMYDERSNIKEFRNDEYSMPWHHTLVMKENIVKINNVFEITSISRPILVNEKGEIIAIDKELRGKKLLNKLEEIF